MTKFLIETNYTSSNIDSLHYIEATKVLYVTFLNGSTYQYQEVPLSAVEGILSGNQGTVGEAFNKIVKKGNYLYSKVGTLAEMMKEEGTSQGLTPPSINLVG